MLAGKHASVQVAATLARDYARSLGKTAALNAP
jgi:hypothetical protein